MAEILCVTQILITKAICLITQENFSFFTSLSSFSKPLYSYITDKENDHTLCEKYHWPLFVSVPLKIKAVPAHRNDLLPVV